MRASGHMGTEQMLATATVPEMIRKTTADSSNAIPHHVKKMSLTNADTRIRKRYIKRRISFLQQNDILLPEKIKVCDSIEKLIKNTCSHTSD